MKQLARANVHLDLDYHLNLEIRQLLDSLARAAGPVGPEDLNIYDVLRYHLGFVDQKFQPASFYRGKRIRPKLCVICCAAAGGDQLKAIPAAAAVELLHNFTLIHDDIQDRSDLRRHRPTVWAVWGTAQAINAGDTMFAVAHLALNRLSSVDVPSQMVLELSTALHETTLRIVEGQVLDLGFEDRLDVDGAEYLAMIKGKTAAILRFACSAGARLAGASNDQADRFGDFGKALGIGFQVLDDELGVWGSSKITGKPEADDILKRKKALPYLILRQSADGDDRQRLDAIYASREPDEGQTRQVLELMTKYEVRDGIQQTIKYWHDRSDELLSSLAPWLSDDSGLRDLVETLSTRQY